MTTFVIAIIATVFGVQLIYWFLLIRNLGTTRGWQGPDDRQLPAVSIIVCAHDEEDNLRTLVPLLMQQDHPNLEVIVVNDRSNDGTYDYMLEQSKVMPRLKVVTVKSLPQHVTGKKYALTLGIKAASNEIVLLTDADCRPVSVRWASAMASSFREGTDLVLGVSPYSTRPGFLNAFIRFETLLTAIQYTGMANSNIPYMGVGRNLAYRKNLFLSGKGFSRHMAVVGGDDDLFVNDHATSQNTVVCAEPEAVVISKPKSTFGDFFVQKIRHLSAGKRYRFSHQMILGLLSLSWILNPPALILSVSVSPWWATTSATLIWIALGSAAVFRFCQGTKTPYPIALVPVMMVIYPVYYAIFGAKALVTKQLKWKK